MANVHLPPVITDVRDCVYFSGHPKEFFEAMDDLKPYVLLTVSNDCASIRLYTGTDVIDLVEFRKKLERLNNLGYHVKTAWHCKKIMGLTVVEMEDLRISWNTSKEGE